jgi:hypothetical protein
LVNLKLVDQKTKISLSHTTSLVIDWFNHLLYTLKKWVNNNQIVDDFESCIMHDFDEHKFGKCTERTLKTFLGTPTTIHLN